MSISPAGQTDEQIEADVEVILRVLNKWGRGSSQLAREIAVALDDANISAMRTALATLTPWS